MKKLLTIIIIIVSPKFFSQDPVSSTVENSVIANHVYEKVDKIAEYPGGINSFRKLILKSIYIEGITERGILRSDAQFVISENGKLENIKVLGDNKSMNRQVAQAIKSQNKNKWKPGEINGKPVKSLFKLSIAMQINN
jgi:hypothetical protein